MKKLLLFVAIIISVKINAQNPASLNWETQVNNAVTLGSSPNTETSYTWSSESNLTQGIVISLFPTEIVDVYMEQNNAIMAFTTDGALPYNLLEVNIDNNGFTTIYNGAAKTSHLWNNLSSLNNIGLHNLKVRFMPANSNSQIIHREYNVKTTSASIGLHKNNNNDVLRVYGNPLSINPIPILISEGFDSHNITPSQFLKYVGNDLMECLINSDFRVYLLNYKFNSQDMRNNSAIYSSAARYISSINNNQEIVAGGISMGGVIARYALAKAEDGGNPLPAYCFVSMDSPQQGAVISKDLQDFKKSQQQNAPNASFLLQSLNNDAAKELLLYNTFDATASLRIGFYNELNGLNGNGYPHLTKNVGISFSNSNAPNYSTFQNWLKINAVNNNYAFNIKTFTFTPEELTAGSYLPLSSTKLDPINQSLHWSLNLPIIRILNDVDVTFTRTRNPTFIPHSSALDIVNNVSKFDISFSASTTAFHDELPQDVIEPLVNAVLKKNVYIQNRSYNSETRKTVSKERIQVGSNVNSAMAVGEVNINTGSNIEYIAGEEILLLPDFSSNFGSDFTAFVSNSAVVCGGGITYQSKNAIENFNDEYVSSIEPIAIEKRKKLNQNIFDSNQSNNPITIYPNPAKSTIFLSFENGLSVKFKIFSIDGRLLKSGDSIANSQIEVDDLVNGIYLLELISSDFSVINARFVINK